MALVVICGLPAAGKSGITKDLVERIRSVNSVFVIDEPSLHLDRQSSYQGPTAEKRTRGQLKAAVDRALSKEKVVVLDSLNSIKGYRYEIWCLARAAGLRYCLVHVNTPRDQAHAWNLARQDGSYPDPVFEDLAGRFEEPDSKNRWEQPLFRLVPGGQDTGEVLQAICDSITAAAAVRPTPGASQPAQRLEPTLATTSPGISRTNLLAELDRATQQVIDAVSEAQTGAVAAGGPVTLEVPGLARPVRLQQPLTLPEARRHKRAFMKLLTQSSYAKLQSSKQGQQMFADYLQNATSV